MLLIAILLSALAGITVVFGRIINSNLAEKIGTFPGTLINYIVGLSFSFLFLLISNETITISTSNMKTIPIWAYFGGVVGVVIVVLSNYITPKISAFYSTLLMFIGQLFSGIIIEFFTSHDMSMGKIVGGLLVLIGLTYNLVIDKKQIII